MCHFFVFPGSDESFVVSFTIGMENDEMGWELKDGKRTKKNEKNEK